MNTAKDKVVQRITNLLHDFFRRHGDGISAVETDDRPVSPSLHIGLDGLSIAAYGGEFALQGCRKDAGALYTCALKHGFSAVLSLDELTVADAIANIRAAKKRCDRRSRFLITYSGHGTQVPDEDRGEESDGLDEAWCLYDGLLLDDVLYAELSQFPCPVILISDSCHSGTIARSLERPSSLGIDSRGRLLPITPSAKLANRAREVSMPSGGGARILEIGGCQDNQLSYDTPDGGVMTLKLLGLLDDKRCASYRSLHRELLRAMPAAQSPSLLTFNDGLGLLDERPLTACSSA